MGRGRLLIGSIALILVAIVISYRLRCAGDIVVTDGSYLGFEIGSPKAEVFPKIEALRKDGSFEGYAGLDMTEVTHVTASSPPDELVRLGRHRAWEVYSSPQSNSTYIRLEEGRISRILIDPDASSRSVKSWAPNPNAQSFSVGMQASAAVGLVRQYLASGNLSEVIVGSADAEQGPPYYTFEALEPWDCWVLGSDGRGLLRLEFSGGKLTKIQHRHRC